MVGMSLPVPQMMSVPDGTIALADRMSLLMLYASGILDELASSTWKRSMRSMYGADNAMSREMYNYWTRSD